MTLKLAAYAIFELFQRDMPLSLDPCFKGFQGGAVFLLVGPSLDCALVSASASPVEVKPKIGKLFTAFQIAATEAHNATLLRCIHGISNLKARNQPLASPPNQIGTIEFPINSPPNQIGTIEFPINKTSCPNSLQNNLQTMLSKPCLQLKSIDLIQRSKK